jgi:hypothetical protein
MKVFAAAFFQVVFMRQVAQGVIAVVPVLDRPWGPLARRR